MKKRILSAVICLVMLFCLFPANVFAADTVDVWVDGRQLTYHSTYGYCIINGVNINAFYDKDTKTLTIESGFTMHGDGYTFAPGKTAAIYSADDLTIVFEGHTSIGYDTSETETESYGIYCGGKLVLKHGFDPSHPDLENVRVSATANNATFRSCGIYAKSLENEVSLTAGSWDAEYTYGIYSEGDFVNTGKLTAHTASHPDYTPKYSCGVYVNGKLENTATVDISATKGDASIGFHADTVATTGIVTVSAEKEAVEIRSGDFSDDGHLVVFGSTDRYADDTAMRDAHLDTAGSWRYLVLSDGSTGVTFAYIGYPQEFYDVAVGSFRFDSYHLNYNNGEAIYDPATRTLTIDGLAVLDPYVMSEPDEYMPGSYAGIYSEGDLNIVVEGVSSVLVSREAWNSIGISCGGKLTVSSTNDEAILNVMVEGGAIPYGMLLYGDFVNYGNVQVSVNLLTEDPVALQSLSYGIYLDNPKDSQNIGPDIDNRGSLTVLAYGEYANAIYVDDGSFKNSGEVIAWGDSSSLYADVGIETAPGVKLTASNDFDAELDDWEDAVTNEQRTFVVDPAGDPFKGVHFFVPYVPATNPGDVNDDGTVNAKDVALMLKKIAGWSELGTYKVENEDYNVDGTFNAKDVSGVVKMLAGWN